MSAFAACPVNVPKLAMTPALIVSVPLIVVASPNVLVPELSRMRLLKVVALLPPIVWPAPSSVMVLPVLVIVAPLFVQSPDTECEKLPVLKDVPLPNVTSPLKSMFCPAVAEAVPPSEKSPLTVPRLDISFVPPPVKLRLL